MTKYEVQLSIPVRVLVESNNATNAQQKAITTFFAVSAPAWNAADFSWSVRDVRNYPRDHVDAVEVYDPKRFPWKGGDIS